MSHLKDSTSRLVYTHRLCEGARALRSKSILVITLLAPGWLAQALDARATPPQSHHVEIGAPYTLTISMKGECHDSSCGGSSRPIPDLGREAPDAVVTIQIVPTGSKTPFELPFRVGGPFIPPISGEIHVELTDDLKRTIKEYASSKCANFEAQELSLISVQPQEPPP